MESSEKEKRKKLFWLYFAITGFLLLTVLLLWLLVFRYRAYTDDAYVEGNQVYITPLRPGFITAIHTDDTFWVEKGRLLIELDRTDAEIALQKAEQELASSVREVCQLFHQLFAYKSEIEIRRAELVKVAQDFQHREELLPSEAISLEDYQHAVAALKMGYYSLKMSENLFDKTLALLQGTTLKNHPLVVAASDNYRQRWVDLYRCSIYSPVEGLAAQRKIQVGMWVEAGLPLLSVIPLDQIWVNANFKETQVRRMRLGQRVKITSDLYGGGQIFHGKVVGLPGAAGNAFSLLPPQNLSGNWIKIVQRLPVRVAIDPEEIRNSPLRVGLSMEATVDLTHQDGEIVPASSLYSPSYKTSIFEGEEAGVVERIEEIFQRNADPKLDLYKAAPLHLQREAIDPNILHYLSNFEISEATKVVPIWR